jgi:hypothetical protein
MDHRALLLKYMSHVLEQLGTTFIDTTSRSIAFSPEELAELRRIETQARVLLRR